jgi:ankyrin repeat protein
MIIKFKVFEDLDLDIDKQVLKSLMIRKNIDFNHSDFNKITNKYHLTPLMEAASENYVDVIEKLIEYGVEIDKVDPYGKQTALMYAAIHGHYKSTKLLIDYSKEFNINIDQVNYSFNTAFMLYCSNSIKFRFFKMNMIELFIDAGINWNLTNNENKTFIDILEDKAYIIKERYPKKYKKYEIIKNSKKFNL